MDGMNGYCRGLQLVVRVWALRVIGMDGWMDGNGDRDKWMD